MVNPRCPVAYFGLLKPALEKLCSALFMKMETRTFLMVRTFKVCPQPQDRENGERGLFARELFQGLFEPHDRILETITGAIRG